MKILALLLLTATSALALTNNFTDRDILIRPATSTCTNCPPQLQQMNAAIASALSNGVANVKSFGAFGNGASNDTAAIQAAVNSSQPVFFPEGSYVCGEVYIGQSTLLSGSNARFETNSGGAWIIQATPTGRVFVVNCQAPVTFRDLGFVGYSAIGTQYSTGGSAISITWTAPPAGQPGNYYSTIDNCVFDQFEIAVLADRAQFLSVLNSKFWNIQPAGDGVFFDVDNGDAGDSTVQNCIFEVSGLGAAGIGWNGGGGLRVLNNKFFGSGALIVSDTVTLTGGTGQLFVHGNSFDNVTTNAPAVSIYTATTPYGSIVINGNGFFGTSSTFLSIVGASTAGSGYSNAIYGVTVSDNHFQSFQPCTIAAMKLDWVQEFNLHGNTVSAGTPGQAPPFTGVGVLVTTNCFNGRVEGNEVYGWGTSLGTNGLTSTNNIYVGPGQ